MIHPKEKRKCKLCYMEIPSDIIFKMGNLRVVFKINLNAILNFELELNFETSLNYLKGCCF